MGDTEDTERAMAKPSTKRRAILIGAGVLVGGLLGFAYYAFVGCASGHCPMTSNPVLSVGYGALFGALLIGSR